MQLRVGFEMTYDCPQPTPMLLSLNIHYTRVSDLASRVGTSRPSIVRFANKLGFEGYTQLQKHVRKDLSRRLTRPSERIRNESENTPPARAAMDRAMNSVFKAIEGNRLAELAEPLVKAENVWVLSGETSRAGAWALQSGLSMVRAGVQTLQAHSMSTDLSEAGPGDAAVVFDFYRYRRQVVSATRVLAGAGVSVVAVTDGPLSPLAELADTWCEIEVPAIGPFDSSAPVVAMAELLVSQVAKALQSQATARIDRIEALWEETNVFL